jgi:hypothetical protein
MRFDRAVPTFLAGVVCCAVVLAAPKGLAAPPALDQVLRRMHATVVEHEDDLAGLVSEEVYEQRVLDPGGTTLERRVLRSHYLVFQLPPTESWFACRDVFEVDGSPVPDHRDRLQHVLSLDGTAVDLAYRIYEESARYNIGRVVRTFNLPTFALAFFRPMYRQHLLFAKQGEEDIGGVRTWVIAFRERATPVFVGTPSGKGLAVRGRVWVVAEDGRIVRTEVIVGGERGIREQARVTTSFRLEPLLHIWVPDVMEERYEVPGRDSTSSAVVGHAVYSNARQLALKGRIRLQQLPASPAPQDPDQPRPHETAGAAPP